MVIECLKTCVLRDVMSSPVRFDPRNILLTSVFTVFTVFSFLYIPY